MEEYCKDYPIKVLCETLGVSLSGSYAYAPLRRIYVGCEAQPHEHRNE